MKALSQAIEIVGTQKALADQCGVVQAAVSAWVKRASVPVEHCAAIERATGGVITRQKLRPADWQKIWPELVGAGTGPQEVVHESSG